jgi:hypothetical protein
MEIWWQNNLSVLLKENQTFIGRKRANSLNVVDNKCCVPQTVDYIQRNINIFQGLTSTHPEASTSSFLLKDHISEELHSAAFKLM